MEDIRQGLAATLASVQRPGDFYVAGRQEILAPSISVAEVGVIALPVLPQQAEQLRSVAERAPYGRGAETVVDTAVRRTWQIDPARIHVGGRHWAANLERIVSRCAEGLGVYGQVSAELYKMLVYDEGSFFLGHRDTEKTAGMFATLVIALPSPYAGGELLVRHRGREVSLQLATEDPAELAFAAFYADCWHEVRPITAGCRIALIYNLIRPGGGTVPRPPAHDAELDACTAQLHAWRAALEAEDGAAPRKLIYPLEHIYTSAGIGFAALKNADAAAAAVLAAAAHQARYDLHLAILNIEETGSAESMYYRGRYYDDIGSDDRYEIGEVFERRLSLSDWRAPDGSPVALTRLEFDEDELCPPGVFDDAEADEVHFFEATGNAGASFERSYRRAALVLWPREHRLALIAAAGREVSLPYLAELAARWRQHIELGQHDTAAAWDDGHTLAGLILGHWPALPAWGVRREPACSFLGAVWMLEDGESVLAFVDKVTLAGDYGQEDNTALVPALALLPPEAAAAAVSRIVDANAARDPAACAELLRRISESDQQASHPAALETLNAVAEALVMAVSAQSDAAATSASNRPRATPGLVVDLLMALCSLQALEPAMRLVDYLVTDPARFKMDAVLVPAALSLVAQPGAQRSWPPLRALVGACQKHLAERIAAPLAPPADFARPSRLSCNCQHCAQLAAFLANPQRGQWILKAAQALRGHVEDTIRRDACDVDTETLRHTRPYELRCTKNQASYLRRVEQRKQDEAAYARLDEP